MGATSTARVVRFHERQKAGRVVLAVEVDLVEITAALVAAKLLHPSDVENRDAIARAVSRLCEHFAEERKCDP